MSTRFAPKGATSPPAAPPVDAALLAYVRTTIGSAIGYAEAPREIVGGFETAIFAFSLTGAPAELSGPLILRLHREEADPEQARFEGCVQNAVADAGFPAPRVLTICTEPGVLGGAFTIMQRAPGRTMIDSMLGPGVFRISGVLGRLHAQLHGLGADSLRSRLSGVDARPPGIGLARDADEIARFVDEAQLDGLRDGVRWLAARRPGPPVRLAVCHGDFHPINIMVSGRDVTGVLDWSSTHIGDPAWDVGASVALLGYGPVNVPGVLYPAVTWLRRRLVGRYLSAYASALPLDRERVRYYEAMRLLLFLTEAGFHRRAVAGVVAPTSKPTAFHQPAVLNAIARRFTAITGVVPSLPPKVAARA
jgi:aminoglycoside phosphotransferase (APT) family kinase protein